MDVLDAIEHAEADLARTLEELQMARELVAALEQDAKKMKIEIVGLKSYAQRQGLSESTSEAASATNVLPISADVDLDGGSSPDLALMSRTDAVMMAMRSHPGPVDRSTIHEALVDGGRFDSIDDVSLTLSGLKRSGRAERLGQGLWQLADSIDAEAASAH